MACLKVFPVYNSSYRINAAGSTYKIYGRLEI